MTLPEVASTVDDIQGTDCLSLERVFDHLELRSHLPFAASSGTSPPCLVRRVLASPEEVLGHSLFSLPTLGLLVHHVHSMVSAKVDIRVCQLWTGLKSRGRREGERRRGMETLCRIRRTVLDHSMDVAGCAGGRQGTVKVLESSMRREVEGTQCSAHSRFEDQVPESASLA